MDTETVSLVRPAQMSDAPPRDPIEDLNRCAVRTRDRLCGVMGLLGAIADQIREDDMGYHSEALDELARSIDAVIVHIDETFKLDQARAA